MRVPRRRGCGGTHLSVKNILWRICHYSQITWNQRFFCFLFLSCPLFLSEKFAVGLCIYNGNVVNGSFSRDKFENLCGVLETSAALDSGTPHIAGGLLIKTGNP